MSASASGPLPIDLSRLEGRGGWPLSATLYAAFAIAVFVVHGPEPLLGADHISYIGLANSILTACPNGDYWRELSSVRTLSVLLAYLHGATGSHVLSMKIVLAVFSVPFLLASELFFRLFASRWEARLFAVLSAFAVSFGISSWGITDSTALLARTLVAPVIMLSAWIWFRFDARPLKYLAFPVLVAGSLLHLSAFYMAGVLGLVELWDLVVLRRLRYDQRVPQFLAALLGSALLLFVLEVAGPSSKVIGIQVPEIVRAFGGWMENIDSGKKTGCAATMLRPRTGEADTGTAVPRVVVMRRAASFVRVSAPAATAPASPDLLAQETNPLSQSAENAWKTELALRPWRNMPLPLVNVANILSSYALIMLLALAGAAAAGRTGFTRTDGLMAGMFLAVPLIALGPQTLMWYLRTRTSVHPINIEEIRALGLIMIPSLYFILRLFQRTMAGGGPRVRWKAAAIVVGVLALPLAMKGLPAWAREGVLSAMIAAGVVDPASESRVANARAALGLGVPQAPLYYSTQRVRDWLSANTPYGARILTDRDDMILLRNKIIVGPRQVSATTYVATKDLLATFLETSRAMQDQDTRRLLELARLYQADFAVVPWRIAGAAYSDDDFSVLAVPRDGPKL